MRRMRKIGRTRKTRKTRKTLRTRRAAIGAKLDSEMPSNRTRGQVIGKAYWSERLRGPSFCTKEASQQIRQLKMKTLPGEKEMDYGKLGPRSRSLQ